MPLRSFVHVVSARALGGHRVWLRFDDGVEGEVDLAAHLDGEVFAPLRDHSYFAQLCVGEGRTLEWPNGADFAPETARGPWTPGRTFPFAPVPA